MESDKLQVKCSYPLCKKYFKDVKEMKSHKKHDPDHYYCKKCDLDCVDWDDLVQHKIEKMEPWLNGRMKANKDGSPAHIVCEFCGEDFKSFGGCEQHRKLLHPADQNIVCPGCARIFIRANHLIAHFEEDKCEGISYRDYISNVTHKHVNAEINKNFDEYREKVRLNKKFEAPGHPSDSVYSQSEFGIEDGDDGGICILDYEHEDQRKGLTPLVAKKSGGSKSPSTQGEFEAWPRLSSQAPSVLTDDFENMSIRSTRTPLRGPPSSTMTSPMSATYTESYPALRSSGANTPTAWTTGASSKTLFPDAKGKGSSSGGSERQLYQQVEAAGNSSGNILTLRLWDPNAQEYDIERFRHPVISVFCCPFPGCDGTYDHPGDFEEHLHVTHIKTEFKCTRCQKRFGKGSSLIAHAEAAGGKCRVADTEKFNELLNVVSGGFLTARSVKQPKLLKVDHSALIKPGQPVGGVMSTKYTAQMPTADKEATIV